MPLTKKQRADIDRTMEFFFLDMEPGWEGIKQKLQQLCASVSDLINKVPNTTPLANLLATPQEVLRDLEYGNPDLTTAEVQQYIFLYYIGCLQYHAQIIQPRDPALEDDIAHTDIPADFTLVNWLANYDIDSEKVFKNPPPLPLWLIRTKSYDFLKSVVSDTDFALLTFMFPEFISSNPSQQFVSKRIVTDNLGASHFLSWEVVIPDERIFTAKIIEVPRPAQEVQPWLPPQARTATQATTAPQASTATQATSAPQASSATQATSAPQATPVAQATSATPAARRPSVAALAPLLNLEVSITLDNTVVTQTKQDFVPYPNFDNDDITNEARRVIREERAPAIAEGIACKVVANYFKNFMLHQGESSPDLYCNEIIDDRDEEIPELIDDTTMQPPSQSWGDVEVVYGGYEALSNIQRSQSFEEKGGDASREISQELDITDLVFSPSLAPPPENFDISSCKGVVLLTYKYYFNLVKNSPIAWMPGEISDQPIPHSPSLFFITQASEEHIQKLRSPTIIDLLSKSEGQSLGLAEVDNLQLSTVNLLDHYYYQAQVHSDLSNLNLLNLIEAKYVPSMKKPTIIHLLEKNILSLVLLPQLLEAGILLAHSYYYKQVLADENYLDCILGISEHERIRLENDMIIFLLEKNLISISYAKNLSDAGYEFISHPLVVRQVAYGRDFSGMGPADLDDANRKNRNTNTQRLLLSKKITPEQVIYLSDRSLETLEKYSKYTDMMLEANGPIKDISLMLWTLDLYLRLTNIYHGKPALRNNKPDSMPILIGEAEIISRQEKIDIERLQTQVIGHLLRFFAKELHRKQAKVPWQSPPYQQLQHYLQQYFQDQKPALESFNLIRQLAGQSLMAFPVLHPSFSLSLSQAPDESKQFWSRIVEVAGFIPQSHGIHNDDNMRLDNHRRNSA